MYGKVACDRGHTREAARRSVVRHLDLGRGKVYTVGRPPWRADWHPRREIRRRAADAQNVAAAAITDIKARPIKTPHAACGTAPRGGAHLPGPQRHNRRKARRVRGSCAALAPPTQCPAAPTQCPGPCARPGCRRQTGGCDLTGKSRDPYRPVTACSAARHHKVTDCMMRPPDFERLTRRKSALDRPRCLNTDASTGTATYGHPVQRIRSGGFSRVMRLFYEARIICLLIAVSSWRSAIFQCPAIKPSSGQGV